MVLNADTYTLIQEAVARAELSYELIADLFGVTEDVVSEAASFLTTEDDGQPSTYDEYQDLPYGGDDAFETCNHYEDI